MALLLVYFLTLAGIICCQGVITQMRVTEDEDVILPCSLNSTNIRSEIFNWKKDYQKEVFQYSSGSHSNNGRGGQDPQFKGRVFNFEDQLQSGNASIEIRNTTYKDSGSYSCIFPYHQQRIRSIIELIVVIKMRVKEDKDVILPCSLDSTNIRTQTFNWKKDDQNVFQYSSGSHYHNGRGDQDPQFKGRVFHFEDQLQSGNASIEIRKTKVTDTGSYRCIFPFHQQRIRSIIELIVGSCPEPSVTNLHQTKDWALLECEVQGVFPKPKVQWLDSENKTVPAEEPQETESEGKYNIILKATVTKSDVYRCVSTQEEICHQIDRKIEVVLSGKDPGYSVGWVIGLSAAIVLLLIIAIGVLYYKRKSRNKPAEAADPEAAIPLTGNGDGHQNVTIAKLEAAIAKLEAATAVNHDAGQQNERAKLEEARAELEETKAKLRETKTVNHEDKPAEAADPEAAIPLTGNGDGHQNDKDPVVYEDPIVISSNRS